MEDKIREIVDRYSERGNGNDHMVNELCDLFNGSLCLSVGDLVEFEDYNGVTKRGYINKKWSVRVPWGYENHPINETIRVIQKNFNKG